MVVRVGLAVQWTGGAAAPEDGGGVTVLCCACWAAQHSSEPGLGRGGAPAQSQAGSVLRCFGVGCWLGCGVFSSPRPATLGREVPQHQ